MSRLKKDVTIREFVANGRRFRTSRRSLSAFDVTEAVGAKHADHDVHVKVGDEWFEMPSYENHDLNSDPTRPTEFRVVATFEEVK